MTLDSWLVGRLGHELHAALAGARVEEASTGAQSLTLACYRRGARPVFRASLEPERPLAAVAGEASTTNESGASGWLAGVAPLLRGSVIDAVQAVAHDRILNVDMSSRSAFGVPARHRLALELEPRKANALVLRPGADGSWSILAAAKRFEGREGARAVAIGEPYEPPPQRHAMLDRAAFFAALADALEADASSPPSARVIARLLGEFDPDCTPPLAREVIEQVLRSTPPPARRLFGESLLAAWTLLKERVERHARSLDAPVYAYRQGDDITAFHLVPLSWPTGSVQTVRSVNDVCGEMLSRAERRSTAPIATALRRKLELMLARCREQADHLRAAQRRAEQAEPLRIAGDAIYANLAFIPDRSTSFAAPDGTRITLDPQLTPKQNAAAYFKRYKKARSGLPRIAARLAVLEANRAYWEQLLWELERAQVQPELRAAIFADVEAAVGRRTARRGSRMTGAVEFARPKPRTSHAGVPLPGGAVAYVGKSPKDNEHLTFTMARPNDYWFHARNIPGAHVILKMPHAGDEPTTQQIEMAASLAAGASRAADAGKVEVDYTRRKHVRRQGHGRIGLVWYTDFKTVLVAPRR